MGILAWLKNSESEKEGGSVEIPPAIPNKIIGEFLTHFPIGSKVKYFPEFQKAIKLDTLILGYMINNHMIFTARSIAFEANDGAFNVRINREGVWEEILNIGEFRFIIPHKFRNEVDYPVAGAEHNGKKFVEKTVNDFHRGNAITLFRKGAGGKVPHITTTVLRTTELKEGYYSNTTVVMLNPDLESFEFLDQRKYIRLYSKIPAVLSIVEQDEQSCIIQDFSEKSFRISMLKGNKIPGNVIEGMKVTLTIKLENESDQIVLRCSVAKKNENYLVLFPTAIEKDKRFRDFDQMDELFVKTTLIHHPQSQT